MSLAADGDALGVREPADEPDGGGGGGHHQRRPLPRQVAHARIHREGQGRRLRRRRRAKVSDILQPDSLPFDMCRKLFVGRRAPSCDLLPANMHVLGDKRLILGDQRTRVSHILGTTTEYCSLCLPRRAHQFDKAVSCKAGRRRREYMRIFLLFSLWKIPIPQTMRWLLHAPRLGADIVVDKGTNRGPEVCSQM